MARIYCDIHALKILSELQSRAMQQQVVLIPVVPPFAMNTASAMAEISALRNPFKMLFIVKMQCTALKNCPHTKDHI